MNETLFVEERRRIILDELREQGRVSVKLLSERLGVSAVTIRQDLRALEEEGLLKRTYGGAVHHETMQPVPELSFHIRQTKKRDEKAAIAEAAAALVQDGYSVALDASSTAFALASYLKTFRKLTVVTNSLILAQSFLDSPHIQVILPGGRLRRDSISVVGFPQGLPEINFNIGFFGARGVTLAEGVTDVDGDEVTIKRAMVARCVQTVILVDGSKWGQVAPFTFVRSEDVRHIITSSDSPTPLVDSLRQANVQITIAVV
ncbi:MAG: DeoR/GlpR family DNA-binding transcription regulator [Chloroflexota bacterium]|nr:DeoR/GlpR family DNA-binding transcription regulator [Chloroflexota bacterium]